MCQSLRLFHISTSRLRQPNANWQKTEGFDTSANRLSHVLRTSSFNIGGSSCRQKSAFRQTRQSIHHCHKHRELTFFCVNEIYSLTMKTDSPFQIYFGVACQHFQFDNFIARLADDQEQVVAVMIEEGQLEPDICKALTRSEEPSSVGKVRFRGTVNRIRYHLARAGYLLQ